MKKIILRSIHCFGRNAAKADTVLDNVDASQIHASIRWNGELWELIDHSSNGTLVNGKRIAPKGKLVLENGQKIQFAPRATVNWVVLDLDAPRAILLSKQDGTPDMVLDNFNLLPDEAEPSASLYLTQDGLWMLETFPVCTALRDGDMVHVGSRKWLFTCSTEIEPTAEVHHWHMHQHRQDDPLFHFDVSLNEEHISLYVINAMGKVDLGERTHHYALLTLARRRLADAARGLDASSQGWIETEELSTMLGLEPNHLNMQVFRARSQIAKAMPHVGDAGNVIERRRCEVRFGQFRFQIKRGTELEGSFSPA